MFAIAAMACNRVIGAGGKIPWHLPEDFRWFKRATLGGVVVMGRKTFESLGRPLPGRLNVVVSRTVRSLEGAEVLGSLEELLQKSFAPKPVWIIGGAELYAQALPHCTDLYLSRVELSPEGDAFFPEFEGLFDSGELVESHPGFEVWHYRRTGAVPEGG